MARRTAARRKVMAEAHWTVKLRVPPPNAGASPSVPVGEPGSGPPPPDGAPRPPPEDGDARGPILGVTSKAMVTFLAPGESVIIWRTSFSFQSLYDFCFQGSAAQATVATARRVRKRIEILRIVHPSDDL